MRPFDTLTTRGRARRLRVLASRALAAYDLDARRIRLVNNVSNCTFRVDAADGSAYALRINLPGARTAAEIRSELTWQEAVCTETDIPAPRPVRTRDGDLIVQAAVPGVPEPRLCNLSTWVPGRTLRRAVTPESFRQLGELSARLHQHGATFEPPEGFTLPRLDTVLPASRPDRLFTGQRPTGITPEAYALLQAINAAVEEELARLFQPGYRPQVIHGDLHWWNVLVYCGKLQPIDFEDCAWGFPAQDIAITFYYVLWDERYDSLLAAFREGYERIQAWPEDFPGQLDLLLGQRALDLINLLLDSPYREDRELIPAFVGIVEQTYRSRFERAMMRS